MPEQGSVNVQVEVTDAIEESSALQLAADLLVEGQEASTYEEGTSFAVMSIAHSVLHMARGSGVLDPMSLRVLCVRWERLAREARADDEASDAAVRGVFAQCAGEVRALLGDVR